MSVGDDASSLAARFDSYCKKVIRNRFYNSMRDYANKLSKEVLMDDALQSLIGESAFYEALPTYVIECLGFRFHVHNESLGLALDRLPEHEKCVIMFGFFKQWSDAKMADFMRISTRTVYNRRKRALRRLRVIYPQIDKGDCQ